MNNKIKLLVVIALLISVVSAALLTEYFRTERTVTVEQWMSFEVNPDPRDVTFGMTTLYDYINVTPHKQYMTPCEIETVVKLNGNELEDLSGIVVSYSVETGSGSLIPAPDYNDNGLPDAHVFGTQDGDGVFTIRRNIWISEDLIPGTYTVGTILIPHQGEST